jgi:hypothetical protein
MEGAKKANARMVTNAATHADANRLILEAHASKMAPKNGSKATIGKLKLRNVIELMR